ncbi:receptor-like protein 6 [Apium graveolens]|uniref:receptor-like protein 6 n=1 Tax=Apium graveolens TaxID=4045 RepID=UPI003D78B72D
MAASHSFTLLILLFLLHFFHFITISHTIDTAKSCHDHERSALLHFKQSLFTSSSSPAYSKTSSWKSRGNGSSDCCLWDGVECDDATGYVIGLDLSSSLITATLHSNSTLFSLVHLQNLNLADNDFMNSFIPPEISRLSSLSSLNLSHSSFSGQIPLEFSEMSELTFLDLSENNLYGDFPVAIFSLPGLLFLYVSDNQNLSGYLPEFNNTNLLRELDTAYTNFSGNIPASIGNLQSLTRLRLRNCFFSGSIPASIGNLTQLTFLSVGTNMFNNSGDLSWLHKLTKLTLLNLEDTNLYGDIPPSLANLTQLFHLNLKYNYFVGEITPSLASLTRLTQFNLNHNYFVGEIPLWLMNMTQLISLDLRYNELTGRIPRSFSQLKNLEYLCLGYNNFTGAVEVDIFQSYRNLTFLDLSRITLIDSHHINFTLPKLEVIFLNSCNLTEFPYFLQFQSNLRMLGLNGNNIDGHIPHWIWNASNNLEAIDLSHNYLTALERNPFAIASKSLRYIDISNNMLQGNLPVPPPNTNIYSAYNNRLTGDISPMICAVMSLKVLDLSNNSMSGTIPQCLANSLEALVFQDNNFTGTIPQMYPKECDLKVMDLSQNQLTGEVPNSLSNCKMLKILDLSNNQIKQTFPTWLGTLPQLQVLLLHSNMFHGAVGSPKIPSEFPMMCIINLSNNFFTGALPVNYIEIWNAMKVFRTDKEQYIETIVSFEMHRGNFVYLYKLPYSSSMVLNNKGVETEYEKISNIFTAVVLSTNKFTGQIPESLGSLQALQLLDLSNNYLTGPIPPSLGNLTQLESLDLSQNKLSGVIPQQLATQLNFLAFFNVSHNLLHGHIPEGPQFKTFDSSSYMENSGLCGFPISKDCGTQLSPPDDDEDDSDEDTFPSGFDWLFILVGLGSGLVIGYVMGDIITDRHPWLIRKIVHKFGRTQKKPRMQKRQIIRA